MKWTNSQKDANYKISLKKKIKNLNRTLTSKDPELIIKNLSTKTSTGIDGFNDEFYKIFIELIPVLHELSQETENVGKFSIHSFSFDF